MRSREFATADLTAGCSSVGKTVNQLVEVSFVSNTADFQWSIEARKETKYLRYAWLRISPRRAHGLERRVDWHFSVYIKYGSGRGS